MRIESFNNTQNLESVKLADGTTQLVLDNEGKPKPIEGDYTKNVKFIISTTESSDKLPTSLSMATMLAYKQKHSAQKLELLTEYKDGTPVTEYVVDVDSKNKPKFTAIDWKATDKSKAIKGFTCTFKPAKKPWSPPSYGNLSFGEQA